MFAIGAFAGLRASELAELERYDVDLRQGVIDIRAKPIRTARRRRLVAITPNLQAWLSRYATHTGRVCPVDSHRDVVTRIAKAAGLEKRPGDLRRSFAAYHIAKHWDYVELLN